MFDKYPYTDFHEMNLDWIIKEMKDLVDSWDSFSGNVTATAHESSEPEVNVSGDLKTSLDFDFGLVRGPRGATGSQGPQGEQGPAGNGLEILDIYPTLSDLQAAHPTGTPGDAYLVGSDGDYALYIWSVTASAWSNGGSLTSPAPSNTAPVMDGVADAGSSLLYSRGDHVHPSDSTKLDKVSGTGVYAVENGTQTTMSFADNSVADALVQYDSVGAINASNINVTNNLSAGTISVADNTILNSNKLYGVANASNAYQPLTTVSASTPVLGIGEDQALQTPSVKFMGTKFANDGSSSDATAEVHFSNAFKINDTDYTQSRIDLSPATASSLGGVKVGSRLSVTGDGTINVLETLETGLLTVNSSAQSIVSHFWALDGDILTIGFKIQAPSGGFPNSTTLFNLPYPAYAGSFVPLYVASDQWLSSNVSIKYSFLTSNSTEYKVSAIPANYWVMGWFTVLVSR